MGAAVLHSLVAVIAVPYCHQVCWGKEDLEGTLVLEYAALYQVYGPKTLF
jgi:hypothetical protein